MGSPHGQVPGYGLDHSQKPKVCWSSKTLYVNLFLLKDARMAWFLSLDSHLGLKPILGMPSH